MSNIGFRAFRKIDRPDNALIERLHSIPTSNINDMMNRLYNTDASIRSLNGLPLVGTAFTVHVPVGDNMLVHLALDLAEPGDVLVVDVGGALERSLAGEITFTYAEKKGLAGFVVNGAVRDMDGIVVIRREDAATVIAEAGKK